MPLFSKSSTPSKQVLVVGGITLNIYSQSKATTPDVPVTIMFLIHGRNGSAERMEGIAHSTLEAIHKQRKASRQPAQDLMIVTFVRRFCSWSLLMMLNF
ncbi:hypothetical protein A0H81_07457 [Grifola frondosa]|uniref:Uncharacterized protein n=1 Tax=Grifola frondosa TaxID=5627 RepID=A0A1C7M6N0_GRIFR|nr:hypothetical protein A0H81_07457 [Grifola frondosa]